MSEPDKTKWVGVRPTDPAENIPVEPGAGVDFEVVQPTAADLKVEAEIAAAQEIEVTQTVPADLQATVTPAAATEFEVVQPTAADLKVEAEIAAAQEIEVTQTVPADLQATVTQAEKDRYNELQAGATQIVKYGNATTGTTTIHTVTAGKTFYLCNVTLSAYNYSENVGITCIVIYTNLLVEVSRPSYLRLNIDQRAEISQNFNPPIEVPATYLVTMISGGANFQGSATIQGYEK